VFDVLGGATRDRSAALVRDGGALVTIADPPTVRPANARAVFFVVEPDRQRLADLASKPWPISRSASASWWRGQDLNAPDCSRQHPTCSDTVSPAGKSRL
jgi:hypothetical protein